MTIKDQKIKKWEGIITDICLEHGGTGKNCFALSAIAIVEQHESELAELKAQHEKEMKDKFCGVPMGCVDVEKKLLEYGYIHKKEIQPILDVYEKSKKCKTRYQDAGLSAEMWQAIKTLCEGVK